MIHSLTSTGYMKRKASRMSSHDQAIEWYKCKINPFYFIFNYVHIPEIGGIIKYEQPLMHGHMKRTIRSVFRYHRCLLMATRQLGKSTIAACLLEWSNNFYPSARAVILNASKEYALENLQKIKFIHEHLPREIQTPLKYKGERKTYLEYEHGAILRVFYPSSNTSPDTLARSLTSAILYIDEAAHIRHMEKAYGSAQPTLSRAREQAAKNGYPYFILITSTPNGSVGDGAWFYEMYQFAIDADMIFDKDDQIMPESEHFVNNQERNGFVRIKFHWSDDPEKDANWYQEQRRDLNFNTRLINQELDLLFVGSTTCIFDDEYLAKLKSVRPTVKIKLPHATSFCMYTEQFNTQDFLLIGVDTAKSLVGDYNAIEVFEYSNFIQVGEFFGKLGSLTKYSEVLMALVRYLVPAMQGRIILCIENNSIGAAIIENLENATDYDYMQYVYNPIQMKRTTKDGTIVVKPKIDSECGINTNSRSKSIMVSALYDYLTNNPAAARSSDFIAQLNIIERKSNGSVSAQSGKHDDLFMAAALCAYVRRISSLDIEPLLGVSTYVQQETQIKSYQGIITNLGTADLKDVANQMVYNENEGGYEYVEDNNETTYEDAPFSIF